MAGIQGPFNPNTFVAGNVATYPLPVTDPLYQPGMWWYCDTAGTFDGTPVIVGDRIYVLGSLVGRGYGDDTYGGLVYGGPRLADWSPTAVRFVVWPVSPPVWDRPAVPYSGCPFGEKYPGWNIVVEAFFNDDANSRKYGFGTYGSEYYGDPDATTFEEWNDITHPSFSLVLDRGSADAGHVVPVDGLVLDVLDPDGVWFPLDLPAAWYRPGVGTRLRVGLLDPEQEYTPLYTGRIERLADIHDVPPRTVTIDAYGSSFDTTVALVSWQRVAESTVARLDALRAAALWDWAPPIYPATPGPTQLAAPVVNTTDVRTQIDRTAISAGWSADTTAIGAPRFRQWPVGPVGDPIRVSDCLGGGSPEVPQVDGFLDGSVGFATTPDTADLTLTGPVRWTAKVRRASWDPRTVSGALQESLYLQNGGGAAITTFLYYTTTQSYFYNDWYTATGVRTPPNQAVANGSHLDAVFDPGVDAYLGGMFLLDDGGQFESAALRSPDGGVSWEKIPATPRRVAAVAPPSSNPIGSLAVGGSSASNRWLGRVYWIQVEKIDALGNPTGEIVWRFDANEYPGGGAMSYVDPRGRTWTLGTAGAITPKIPAVPAVPNDLLAVSTAYISDMADLLTRATATNVDGATVTASDLSAVGQYGVRDRTLGFPLSGLTGAVPEMTGVVDRAVDRFARAVTRTTAIEVDTDLDRRWFDTLLELDTGAPITVVRRGIGTEEYVLDGIVTGFQHRLTPNRWRSTLFVSTLTPT